MGFSIIRFLDLQVIFINILGNPKPVSPVVKKLKNKKGKVIKVLICYDPVTDVLTDRNGAPLKDVVTIGGTRVNIQKYKQKWLKELRGREGVGRAATIGAAGKVDITAEPAIPQPVKKKTHLRPFLKDGNKVDFEELPEVYEVFFKDVTFDEILASNSLDFLTQLKAKVRYGTLRKKEFFILLEGGATVHLVFRGKTEDSAQFLKARGAMCRALKQDSHPSPLEATGMFESIIDLPRVKSVPEALPLVRDVLCDVFSEVELPQVGFSKVPADVIWRIGLDPKKRTLVKHRFE